MPRTVLRGRLRLSTVVLVVLFAATFTTYLLVRPTPASIVHGNKSGYITPVPVQSSIPATGAATSPRPSPVAPSPTPSRLPESIPPSVRAPAARASASPAG